MLSNFNYKCTLFLRVFGVTFSLFLRVYTALVTCRFLYFTLPFRKRFLEFWKRQSWTVLKIAIQLSPTTFLQPERLLCQKLQTKLTTHNQLEQRHVSSSARGELHGRTSQQRCSSGMPRWMRAEPRTRHLWDVRRRRADSTVQSGSCRGRHDHQTDLPFK